MSEHIVAGRGGSYYSEVNINEITAALDSEITRLQQARAILSGIDAPAVAARHRGRPKGSTADVRSAILNVVAPVPEKKRKPMSAEARLRIAAAQKKRWAASKKNSK